MRPAIAILLTLTLGSGALAAEIKPLTRAERKERTAKLTDEHRQFLADIEPILSDQERDAFLRLDTEAQREVFIEDGFAEPGRRADFVRTAEYVHALHAAPVAGRPDLLAGRERYVEGLRRAAEGALEKRRSGG